VNKAVIRISILLTAVAVFTIGCMEQYPNNSQLSSLYRILNYETTFKEQTLLFEMENYVELVDDGEFYITGSGISAPGAYTCSQDETLLSAIEKAGQTASFSNISYTLIKGMSDNEREIKGLALLSGSSDSPSVGPGDLICLKAMPECMVLSQK